MEWQEIEVDGRHTVKFVDLPYVPLTNLPQLPDADELVIGKKLGGTLRNGEWAWLARNSVMQVISLRNGQTISSYEFCEPRGYESCCIKCIEEIFPRNPEVMLLAVILESFRAANGGCSYVALYSVDQGSVLINIELRLHVTCARFMDESACRRSLLQNFDGCLAVGSEEGVIVLLDLNIRKLMSMRDELQENKFVKCHISDYNLSLTEIHRNFQQCVKDGVHFGLLMEVIESPCSIQCMLPIDLILGLAVGLEDGRLALYDLAELQIFYVALPHPEVAMSALVKMDFLEPPDDPRPCLYIWALHENGENLHAVLHSLMYEKRLAESDESTYFEVFQTGSLRLQLPLEATKSVALTCQTISNLANHGEDASNSLCAISWLSVLEGKNKLLIFDLNQWYKEEMPFVLEYGKQPNYLAGYILNGECVGLHTHLNSHNISHFNSMQRFEEHFYPNSLSFGVVLLHTNGCRRYNWEGAQNRVINLLRSSNAAIFLEPNLYFNEIIRTRLMPQFIELSVNSTFSRNAKYEVLLSAALEHNCVSLLRDCAKSWIDGSFMGNFAASTGLSLSTLTDWIWKRATSIKGRCNDLCKSLFEFRGYPLDNREQKELSFITRQLKLLTDLLKEILSYAKKQIPERVWHDLETKHNSLCMASSYQEILLWLINIGLLPECFPHSDKNNVDNDMILYPYKALKDFYANKRSIFAKINEAFISKKSGSCKLLFIDSFIEHACRGSILHEYWLENEGNGLYPPESLEAMIRVMLVPDLDYDSKCAILLYFFLDLNMAIDELVYKDVVANFIKFPSVFKLSAPLIKTVQAFWNLDHDQYMTAIDEFISPFNKNQCYPQWQVELFIEVLLNQKASNLALRVLESQPSLISPLLKLHTLLSNALISEAFHFVRSKNDDTLLETFFNYCLRDGQFGVIRDLALSEREGLILQNILKKNQTPVAESLHFVYLLQKSKYIEAVSYMDELSHKAKCLKNSLRQASQMETPNLVLSAFNTTMTPLTQGLTDVYFRIKNKIKKKEIDNKCPVPLSCQLIKQNANSLLGGIYHSSALSAHFATYYWGEMEPEQTKQAKHLLNSNNAPFLRKPQIGSNSIDYLAKNKISYPQPYKIIEKRTLIESRGLDNEHDEFERQKIENKLNPKKKRRLIGQDVVENLSHFMKKNASSDDLSASEFPFGQEQIEEPLKQAKKTSVELLIEPVKRTCKEFEGGAAEVSEIHSILKTHTPEPSQFPRVQLGEEEKSLRFKLPSPDDNLTDVDVERIQSEDTIRQMIIAQEENLVEDSGKSFSLSGSRKYRQITRSVSEDSEKSFMSSSNKSEDNFYSPLSSQNNSKLDSSNLSRCSYISGPRPRKPLARFSAERSEKSLTPEHATKQTCPSSLNTTSPLKYETAQMSTFKYKTSSSSSLEKTATADDCSGKESYVTAAEALEKPITICASDSNQEISQSTSRFGNISAHVTFAGSKINEFLPEVSSSRVGIIPTKALDANEPQAVQLSEKSTVLDSMTTFECTSTISTPSVPSDKTKSSDDLDKSAEENKRQMLETTLSMSTYDFSILDSTSVQQGKSSLIITATDVTFRCKSSKSPESTKTELDEKENKEIKCEEQLDKSEAKEFVQGKKSPYDDPDYDCIVLSSSSSSLSSFDQERDDCTNIYDICDEDDIGKNENSEFEENNDFDIYNDHSEHSIQEMESSSITEDIQLIEDSSSDVIQQHSNFYDESDSEDMKVDECEEQFLPFENNELHVSSEELKRAKTEIGIEGNEDVNESKLEGFTNVITKSSTLEATTLEKENSKTSENEKYLSFTTNTTPAVDNQINEKDGTLTVTDMISSGDKEQEVEKHSETECVPEESMDLEIDVNMVNSEDRTLLLVPSIIGDQESHASEEKSEATIGRESMSAQIEETKELKVKEEKPLPDSDTEFKAVIMKLETEQKTPDDKTECQAALTAEEKNEYCSVSSIMSHKQEIVSSVATVDLNMSDKTCEDFKENSEIIEEIIEPKENEDVSVTTHTPRKQKNLSGNSATPRDTEFTAGVSSSRRNTRGISVPPQTFIESEEFTDLTPRTRRRGRASSLQPKLKVEGIETGTPDKLLKSENSECPERKAIREISIQSAPADNKISTRRRSFLLDAINEDNVILDSPSTRTRLRSRLNSGDSELNNTTEQTQTPKRIRRNSSTSQAESSCAGTTPRSLRRLSVLSAQEEDSERIPPSPNPSSNKKIGTKGRKNTKEKITNQDQVQPDRISPQSDQSALSEVSYSASRRLTRTQLAVMEKSAALSRASTEYAVTKEGYMVSPPSNKRVTRSTRSSNVGGDSDDAESVSSKLSTVSSITGIKRRVTRSSLKEKDDDDDGVSIASSFGSEKLRHRRSKDKSSPNTTLTTIPEDAPVETKKRGRPPSKH